MADSSIDTKNKILNSAKKEFLEKGFMNASLRTIAANADLTTGAMYRHFKDKDALFCALVDDAIEETRKVIMSAGLIAHLKDGDPLGKDHEEKENQILSDFIDYIYSDFDAFTLLISKSGGSTHENFVNEIMSNRLKRLDVYGRVNLNEFNGRESLQLFIDDYDLHSDNSKYEF